MSIKSTQQASGKAQKVAQEKANFKGATDAYYKKIEDCEVKEKKKKIIERVVLGIASLFTMLFFRKK